VQGCSAVVIGLVRVGAGAQEPIYAWFVPFESRDVQSSCTRGCSLVGLRAFFEQNLKAILVAFLCRGKQGGAAIVSFAVNIAPFGSK
jgi:hypothetical protein